MAIAMGAEVVAHNLALRGTQARTALHSLPPQRRAQMLLLNMASLTTRLLELAGNKDWQGAPNKLVVPALLPGAILPPEAASANSCRDLLVILDTYQNLLFEALAELAELQEMENEKLRLKEAIEAKDSSMREFAKRLRDAQQVLESAVEEFQDYKRPARNGAPSKSSDICEVGLGKINVQELVSYAHRISYTTFAPPDPPDLTAVKVSLPPAPQEEQMRASKLYQVNELDLGLPKLPARTFLAEEAGKLEGSVTPPAHGALAPTVPVGWKLGMPIELPPMPAGWKPGDPIPLLDIPPLQQKPGEAAALPSSAGWAEPMAPGALIKAPPPPPPVNLPPLAPAGVIHVPFVQLDLNPELEDEFATDYSDEDGSSEDD